MSPRKPGRDLLGLLGLAHRAGSVIRGTGAVRAALQRGDVCLVLMARDASETQTKKIAGLLEARGVPSAVLGTREELGMALGGPPLSSVALTKPAFAARFMEKLEATSEALAPPTVTEDEETHAG